MTTSALRELIIEVRAADNNPREVYKVENLIMAAPDPQIAKFLGNARRVPQ